jgi:MFS family permease
LKRVNAITLLNYIVSGSLTLLIPLLLLARGFSISQIGMVLAVLPIVFLVARLIFAAIADYVGWSHVFALINWPSTLFSCVIYYFASSLPVFALGKVLESLRESSYWAVSRTAIYNLSPKKAGNEATRNNATIWFGTAIGGAIAGLSLGLLGFNSTLGLLILISFLIGIPSLMLWKSSSKVPITKVSYIFAPLDPRGRPRIFWLVSIAIMFNSLSIYPLITLLLPAFMAQQLSYDYLTIGTLFMLYNAISALSTYVTSKQALNFKRVILLSVLSVGGSLFLAGSNTLFVLCLLILAFTRGYGISFFEYTVLKVSKDNTNLCVDIGLLHVPMRIAEFASLMSIGFIVQYVGYVPVFLVTGVFLAVYAFLCLAILNYK